MSYIDLGAGLAGNSHSIVFGGIIKREKGDDRNTELANITTKAIGM